jgi:hypothetical protein
MAWQLTKTFGPESARHLDDREVLEQKLPEITEALAREKAFEIALEKGAEHVLLKPLGKALAPRHQWRTFVMQAPDADAIVRVTVAAAGDEPGDVIQAVEEANGESLRGVDVEELR